MKKMTCLFILTYFLGGCAREISKYTIENNDSVKIDESKVVLTRFPSCLMEINDSVLGMINAGQKVSLYNSYTGKNILNFTTEKVNFDSLVKVTFQKRFEGKREYIYDASSAGGLSDGNSQVLSFFYSDSSFYIYVNTLVEVKHLDEPHKMKEYEENPEIKEAIKTAGSVNLHIMEYVEFLFVTDSRFHLKTIIPLYERTELLKENYFCVFQKGFAINKGAVYAPILKSGQTSGTINSAMKYDELGFSLAKLSINDPATHDPQENFKAMDFKDFSRHDFYFSFFKFKNKSDDLLFSSGKEISAIENSEKVFSKQGLKKNEWIGDFYCNDDRTVTMVTYTLHKKAQPTDMERAYGIDSVAAFRIKIVDPKTMTCLAEKALPVTPSYIFLVTKNRILTIEKDKEHYYFKSNLYHES